MKLEEELKTLLFLYQEFRNGPQDQDTEFGDKTGLELFDLDINKSATIYLYCQIRISEIVGEMSKYSSKVPEYSKMRLNYFRRTVGN